MNKPLSILTGLAVIAGSLFVATPAEAYTAGQYCPKALKGQTRIADNGDTLKCMNRNGLRWIVIKRANDGNTGSGGGTTVVPGECTIGTTQNRTADAIFNEDYDIYTCKNINGYATWVYTSTVMLPRKEVISSPGSDCIRYAYEIAKDSNGNLLECALVNNAKRQAILSSSNSQGLTSIITAGIQENAISNGYISKIAERSPIGLQGRWAYVLQKDFVYKLGNNKKLVFGNNGLLTAYKYELCHPEANGFSANIVENIDTSGFNTTNPYIGTCSLNQYGFYTWK